MRFLDRQEAGRRLAAKLAAYRREHPVVLGLPRGGVPVAYEVASALDAPLDVWVVRKVGAPGHPELGVGAVAQGGIVYLDPETIAAVGATGAQLSPQIARKAAEVQERTRLFRGGRPPPQLAGRTVILVDDGIATGATVHAAVQALREAGPGKLVLAVPIAATQSLETLAPLVDEVVCLHATPNLHAVGAWYDDFEQTSDDEVVRLLERAHAGRHATFGGREVELSIPVGGASLNGTLAGPKAPVGLVLFAHGSGSSRFSRRNRKVASILHGHGLATLLFDLLTREEERIDEVTAELRFDVEWLGRRLVEVTDWLVASPHARGLPIGYFGSSTGAAAALIAAAARPGLIGAVVSRGGRPDLAWDHLPAVRAPTLLIVGGDDHGVIELNRQAHARLGGPRRLTIVPGATHLFEEPGALDEVARLAGEWLTGQLSAFRPGTMEEPAPEPR